MRTALIDNGDAYGGNLAELMTGSFGHEPEVLTKYLEGTDPETLDALVIAAIPKNSEQEATRGFVEKLITLGTPILGVGRGCEWLLQFFGAPIETASNRAPGQVRITHSRSKLFEGIPQNFTATRYSSADFGCLDPQQFEVIGRDDEGGAQAVRILGTSFWAVQFHPESVGTDYGGQLFDNFARLAGKEQNRTFRVLHRHLPFAAPTAASFAALFEKEKYSFWLDSSDVRPGLSRFSFLGGSFGPSQQVLDLNSRTTSPHQFDEEAQTVPSIFGELQKHLELNELEGEEGWPFDFNGGYVGYFGYETGRISAAESQWMFATHVVVVDHETETSWMLVLVPQGDESAVQAEQWLDDTEKLLDELPKDSPLQAGPVDQTEGHRGQWSRPQSQYLQDIADCQREIAAGKSLELCLTNTLKIPFKGAPLQAYLRLRSANPAPYGAYLRFDELHILGSSPERFLKIDRQRVAESKPIKGTGKRLGDLKADRFAAKSLRKDQKTRAENLIVADLLRSEFTSICELGTVSIPSLMEVESYKTVHQLVTTVRGRLGSEVSAVDAAEALFPPGSMTGVPKKHAIDFLEKVEGSARGIYSGALGFFGLNGTADLSVIIRTAVVSNSEALIGAGGAVISASDPAAELAEMELKAAAVADALVQPGKGTLEMTFNSSFAG